MRLIPPECPETLRPSSGGAAAPGYHAPVDGTGEKDLLRRYLAHTDAPCPSCGYNLRGAVGERCPECSGPLALGIVRHGPAASLAWFLLLAFGWVFASGTMNSVRNAMAIHAHVANSRLWGFTPAGRTGGNTLGRLAPAPAGDPGAASGGAGFWATAWDVVPAITWASAAWSFTLAVGGALGLLLLGRRHGRPFTDIGDRRMIRAACGLFTVYATWHLVMFLLEFA